MDFSFPTGWSSGFHLALEQAPGRVSVSCSGTLDMADAAAALQPQLLRFHAAVVEAKIPRVELHLEDVEYMNSSALKSFMVWFLSAAKDAGHRYQIVVTFDPARSWQAVSLRPMERLAPETVQLVERARANASG